MPITPIVASVANRCQTMAYQALADFMQAVHDAMVAAAVTFPAPPVAMATLQTDVTNFQTDITAWGIVGNLGSHADWINLQASREQILIDNAGLSGYVQAIARGSAPGDVITQKAIILSAGMRVKNDSNLLALWGPVNNFRQLIKQSLQNSGKIDLRWSKPNVVPGAMSKPPAYNIYKSADNITFALYASTSASYFIDTVGVGNNQYYKIAPVSAAGEGSLSGAISCYGQ